jgi:hypothetical protein
MDLLRLLRLGDKAVARKIVARSQTRIDFVPGFVAGNLLTAGS